MAGTVLEQDLRHLVNDGLMTLFFLVIGLEVKREPAVGQLRTRRAAMLPIFAAGGGMLLPALVFAALTAGSGASAGWGIPMALGAAAGEAVTLGVVLGLVLGKGSGLLAGAWLAVRPGLADRPRGVTWTHLAGLGGLAGIGFTISLFITALAFDDPGTLAAARVGILAGSLLSALAGVALILAARRSGPTPRR